MTTKSLPGSCRRMRGYFFVNGNAMTTLEAPRYSREIEPYRFHIQGDKTYYVNGNKRIFLLNCPSSETIYCGACSRIFFNRSSGGLVLFTPITHLEYVLEYVFS